MNPATFWIALFAAIPSMLLAQGISDCNTSYDLGNGLSITPSGDLSISTSYGSRSIEICNPTGENIVLNYQNGDFPYCDCDESMTISDGANTYIMDLCSYYDWDPYGTYVSSNSCITLTYHNPYGCTGYDFTYDVGLTGYSGSLASALGIEIFDVEPGCISYFATNYDPVGPQNSLACNYEDLQGLLLDGVSLDDLVASGVEDCDLIGLFAAGGIVVDVDRENKRALIGMAVDYFLYDDNDDLTGSLRGDEFLDVAFSTDLYAGAKNWDIIKRSYGTRYSTNTSSGTSGMSLVQSLGLVNILGYDDWYVPNQSELQLYYDLYFVIGGQSVNWPVDPNGGSSSLYMYFPANPVTLSNWTSDVLNYGETSTAVYRVIDGTGFQSSVESN